MDRHKMEQLLQRTKSKVKKRLRPSAIHTEPASSAGGHNHSNSAPTSPNSPSRANRPLPPTPVAPGVTFGATLPLLASLEDVTPALQETWCFVDGIPKLVDDCLHYLSQYLRTEGLFRISASLNDVKALKSQYQAFPTTRQISLPPEEPHLVASLLKAYLRELAEPLLTFELYDVFIAANGICLPEPRLACIKRVLAMLPALHAALLQRLVRFLRTVADVSEENKMTAANLATVFAPNLLRAEEETPAMLLTESKDAAQMLQTMIEEVEYLFTLTDGEEEPSLLGEEKDQAEASPLGNENEKEQAIASTVVRMEHVDDHVHNDAEIEHVHNDAETKAPNIPEEERSPSLFVEAVEHLPSDTSSDHVFQLEEAASIQ